MKDKLDVAIVGSGPNGLSAAIELARNGLSVRVFEAHDRPGGGTRTEEITLPGFRHDLCAAAHPTGVLSPALSSWPLEDYGLTWLYPEVSAAHPLLDEQAVLLKDVDSTAEGLGEDETRWKELFSPWIAEGEGMMEDILAPLRLPRHPWLMARLGWFGVRSAVQLAHRFEGKRAKALLAGCAAHSLLPLEAPLTGAVALLFALTAHLKPWPVAKGGTERLTEAMVGYLNSLGGSIECEHPVHKLDDLPESRAVLFNTGPKQMLEAAGKELPWLYRQRLRQFQFGPGVFKVDYALDGPIPWQDPQVNKACTVHLGGPLDAVAESERTMWEGRDPTSPFVMMVQPSALDPSRAPPQKHVGYAYIHVPAGSDKDFTEVVETQIERHAPGFRARILSKVTRTAAGFERYNPNWVGGAITGGVMDYKQAFFRPIAHPDPYRTPNPRLFIGSAAAPPGGGVHGMCGFHAARSILRRLRQDS